MPDHTIFARRGDGGPAFPPAAPPAPKLAVLIPTRNEAANIEELLRRVAAAVTGIPTEIVFVDDRVACESKGSLREGLTYLGALGDLRLGREV